MLRRSQQFSVSEDILEVLQVKMVTVHIKTVINAWGTQHISLNLGGYFQYSCRSPLNEFAHQ